MRRNGTVIAAIDFSNATASVLRAARDMAEAFGGELRVVHIVHDLQRYTGYYVSERPLHQLQREIDQEAATKVRASCQEVFGDELPAIEVVKGTPYADLNAWVREAGGDLLVVGAHGTEKPEHKIFGSTAERLVKTSPCPVLVVGQA